MVKITKLRGVGLLAGTCTWFDPMPYGINDVGRVVGDFESAFGDAHHAFITGPNGSGMTDLGTQLAS